MTLIFEFSRDQIAGTNIECDSKKIKGVKNNPTNGVFSLKEDICYFVNKDNINRRVDATNGSTHKTKEGHNQFVSYVVDDYNEVKSNYPKCFKCEGVNILWKVTKK